VSDAAVDAALANADLVGTLRAAFLDLAQGRAAMQPRVRTDCESVRLSTLGAIWPARDVAGAKIYTTIAGRFSFIIVLFSTVSGEVLATFDANAITRWRTAAVSLLAAQCCARTEVRRLALFGTGVQAKAHLAAFAGHYALQSVHVVSRGDASSFVREARALAGCEVHAATARAALAEADVVITATRATAPLFDGAWLAPGTFVCAVGSSKPDTRELDDAAIARATTIVVEWREQALVEAGDLVLADSRLLSRVPVIELGAALREPVAPASADRDIVIFKSVGVGLEDVATAELVYRRQP